MLADGRLALVNMISQFRVSICRAPFSPIVTLINFRLNLLSNSGSVCGQDFVNRWVRFYLSLGKV